MIRNVDHIGIAVTRLETRLPFWAEALGLTVSGIETVDREGVRVALLSAGATRIELLESTREDSPVARFLARRGEGLHHLTLEVLELDAALRRLAERGIAILGDGARDGAEGRRVAFLDPKAAGGVLVELVELGQEARPPDSAAADVLPGAPVLLYLREPQEKFWGLLRSLSPSGVSVEGVDLGSFEDWLAQIGTQDEQLAASVLFVPMGRVEKILLDRPSGPLPSLAQRVQRRTGLTPEQALRRTSLDG